MSNRLPTLFERQVEFQQKNGKSQIHLIYPWPGNFFKFLFQRCIWETGINLYPIISLKSSTLPCTSWLIFLYFNECILAGKKGYCRRKERKLRHNKPRWNVNEEGLVLRCISKKYLGFTDFPEDKPSNSFYSRISVLCSRIWRQMEIARGLILYTNHLTRQGQAKVLTDVIMAWCQ